MSFLVEFLAQLFAALLEYFLGADGPLMLDSVLPGLDLSGLITSILSGMS